MDLQSINANNDSITDIGCPRGENLSGEGAIASSQGLLEPPSNIPQIRSLSHLSYPWITNIRPLSYGLKLREPRIKKADRPNLIYTGDDIIDKAFLKKISMFNFSTWNSIAFSNTTKNMNPKKFVTENPHTHITCDIDSKELVLKCKEDVICNIVKIHQMPRLIQLYKGLKEILYSCERPMPDTQPMLRKKAPFDDYRYDFHYGPSYYNKEDLIKSVEVNEEEDNLLREILSIMNQNSGQEKVKYDSIRVIYSSISNVFKQIKELSTYLDNLCSIISLETVSDISITFHTIKYGKINFKTFHPKNYQINIKSGDKFCISRDNFIDKDAPNNKLITIIARKIPAIKKIPEIIKKKKIPLPPRKIIDKSKLSLDECIEEYL